VRYKIAKREAKKAVTVAKNKAYEKLQQKLDSKECEKEVFNLGRGGSVTYIKDEDGKVLINDTKIDERWQSYFYELFNGEMFHISQQSEQKSEQKGREEQ